MRLRHRINNGTDAGLRHYDVNPQANPQVSSSSSGEVGKPEEELTLEKGKDYERGEDYERED